MPGATPRYPSKNYLAGDFVVSAGSVLFRRSETNQLQCCLLFYRAKSEWLLPKGRKDCGETLEAAAVRETFEETGYPCELLPCKMPTRAPPPGVNVKDVVRLEENLTEPIAITVRDLGETDAKIIYWYVTWVADDAAKKVEGTQMDGEDFQSEFLDCEVALKKLTFESDREIVAKAIEIVKVTKN